MPKTEKYKPETYEQFSVEDFAADHAFVRWVRLPDAPGDVFWRQWIELHPHKRQDIEQARVLVKSIRFAQPAHVEELIEPLWDRIDDTNQEQPAVKHQSPFTPRPPQRRNAKRTRAAFITTLLLIMGCSISLYWYIQGQPHEYITGYGETQRITLPDGSVAILNANSRLQIGTSQTQREVWLDGEAFFSVKKKINPADTLQHIKFTVHTHTVNVDVLGTEFTVAERSSTRVVLNTGAIRLTMAGKQKAPIHMKPGDMVEILHGDARVIRRDSVDPQVYSAWKDKVWILDGLTLEQVADRITETFGVTVVIKNHIVTRRQVSGVVPVDNLDTLLKALSTAFERSFVHRNHQIIIE